MKKLLLLCLLALPSLGATSGSQVFFNAQSEVTCSSGGNLLVAANSRRRFLLIQNKGAVAIYVQRTAAPTPTAGIRIDSGSNLLLDVAVPTQAIYCATASSTAVTVVQEGV